MTKVNVSDELKNVAVTQYDLEVKMAEVYDEIESLHNAIFESRSDSQKLYSELNANIKNLETELKTNIVELGHKFDKFLDRFDMMNENRNTLMKIQEEEIKKLTEKNKELEDQIKFLYTKYNIGLGIVLSLQFAIPFLLKFLFKI